VRLDAPPAAVVYRSDRHAYLKLGEEATQNWRRGNIEADSTSDMLIASSIALRL
jgi:hypothetical protein